MKEQWRRVAFLPGAFRGAVVVGPSNIAASTLKFSRPIAFFERSTGELVGELQPSEPLLVSRLALRPGNHMLAGTGGSTDGARLIIVDSELRQEMSQWALTHHSAALSWSPDGEFLAIDGGNGIVKILKATLMGN